MSSILISIDRSHIPEQKADFLEILGDFSLGLLRIAFGKSVQVKILESGKAVFEESSYGKVTRCVAFFFLVVTSPITIIPALLIISGSVKSKSYQATFDLYLQSLAPPGEKKSKLLDQERMPVDIRFFHDGEGIRDPYFWGPVKEKRPNLLDKQDVTKDPPSQKEDGLRPFLEYEQALIRSPEQPAIPSPNQEEAPAQAEVPMVAPESEEDQGETSEGLVASTSETKFFNSERFNWSMLPEEVRIQILCQLKGEDLNNFAQVSKQAAVDVSEAAIFPVQDLFNEVLDLINHLFSIERTTLEPANAVMSKNKALIRRKKPNWELRLRCLDALGAREGKNVLDTLVNDLAQSFGSYVTANQKVKRELSALSVINSKPLTLLQKKLIEKILEVSRISSLSACQIS